MDWGKIEGEISEFIRTEVEKCGGNGVVLGFSGGVDSAVVMNLALRAFGNEGVLVLLMPSNTTSPAELMEAERYIQKLEVRYRIIHIDQIMEAFKRVIGNESENASGNLQARIRMCLLYYFANAENLLVAGTGNKSELGVGYFTKYGDGGVDILPIGDLYKTEVRELAKQLEVPDSIIDKPPSAGLKPNQTDEEEIGIDYEKLDIILKDLELGKSPTEASLDSGSTLEQAKSVMERKEKNRHKLLLPPIFRLSNRGHGSPLSTMGAGLCLVIGIYLAKLAFTDVFPSLKILSIALIAASLLAFLPV